MFKKLAFLFLFLITPLLLFGATFYSQGSGNFHTVALWNINPTGGTPAGRPNNGDFNSGANTFIIQVGHTMTSSARLESVKLQVNGSLIINDDRFSVTDTLFISSTGSISINTGTPIDLGGAYVISYGEVTSPNGGTFTNYVSSTLPLELAYFETKWDAKSTIPQIKIIWETYTEQDVYEFIVRADHKKDPIGVIPGAGTSYTPKLYNLVDPDPPLTGAKYLLYERTLNNAVNFISFSSIGPNPNVFRALDTGTELILSPVNSQSMQISVYDLSGRRLVSVSTPAGTHVTRFNYSELNLSSGIYLIQIKQGLAVSTRKLPIR